MLEIISQNIYDVTHCGDFKWNKSGGKLIKWGTDILRVVSTMSMSNCDSKGSH